MLQSEWWMKKSVFSGGRLYKTTLTMAFWTFSCLMIGLISLHFFLILRVWSFSGILSWHCIFIFCDGGKNYFETYTLLVSPSFCHVYIFANEVFSLSFFTHDNEFRSQRLNTPIYIIILKHIPEKYVLCFKISFYICEFFISVNSGMHLI